MVFADRADGGRRLAEELAGRELVEPIVLGLPRGGIPVGFEVARSLGAALEVFVVRKVGAPRRPEYGIGAVAEGGTVIGDHAALHSLGLDQAAFDHLVEREQEEVRRRVGRYRADRPLPELAGRDVVVVDDGLATGVTAEAGLRDLRRHAPRRLVLAVPVCAPDTATRLAAVADEVVCVESPPDFQAVGRWYERFDQTTDDEVVDLLEVAASDTSLDPLLRQGPGRSGGSR